MIASCTAIAVLTLLIQQILLSAELVRVADRMPIGGDYLAREVYAITREVLSTSFLLVLPLIVAVALSASARIPSGLGPEGEVPSPRSDGSEPARELPESRDAA